MGEEGDWEREADDEREGKELAVAIGLFTLWIAVWGVLVLPWGGVGGWVGGFEGDGGVGEM